MDNEKYAKNPILYIHQPQSEEIHAVMQYNYRTIRERNENEADQENHESNRPIYKQTSEYEVDAEYETEKKEGKHLKEKKFHEMTLEEQLLYLTEKPVYAPQVVCEIRTDKGIDHGVISNYKDGIAYIRGGDGIIEIPKDKINQIRIISF